MTKNKKRNTLNIKPNVKILWWDMNFSKIRSSNVISEDKDYTSLLPSHLFAFYK